jgi:APA family basic amino acid/polyamine antiporter
MFAQARDRLLFSFLGRVHARFQTPAAALWAQAVLACVASLGLMQFDRLISGFVFTIWIFYGLAAASIFTLRIRRPHLHRPFRCWGYPVVPAVFVLAAAGMLVMSIFESPWDTLPWLGVLLLGIPAFYIWQNLVRDPREAR